MISTIEFQSEERIGSFKGDGGPVELEINYLVDSGTKVNGLVETRIEIDCPLEMLKKGT